jgi:hypothetical protein
MKAHAGDRLVIKGHHVGEHDRVGRIVEVQGKDGNAPFVVEWDDIEGQHMFWPGSDAVVVHPGPDQSRA